MKTRLKLGFYLTRSPNWHKLYPVNILKCDQTHNTYFRRLYIFTISWSNWTPIFFVLFCTRTWYICQSIESGALDFLRLDTIAIVSNGVQCQKASEHLYIESLRKVWNKSGSGATKVSRPTCCLQLYPNNVSESKFIALCDARALKLLQ